MVAPTLTVGSLFSGIGGLDLGFERAGFTPLWFCERDDYCQRILARHWPGLPIYDDVTTLNTADGPTPERPDVLAGGFPCQDLSVAGAGAGLNGSRSGLWWEFHRLIGELRPRYVVVENVPALTSRGFDAFLGSLAALGYDAEWEIVSAAAVGAPHLRERIFVVAYPGGVGRHRAGRAGSGVPHGDGYRARTVPRPKHQQQHRVARHGEGVVAYPDRGRFERHTEAADGRDEVRPEPVRQPHANRRRRGDVADASGAGREEPDAPRVAGDAGHAAGRGAAASGLPDAECFRRQPGAGLREGEPGRIGRGRPRDEPAPDWAGGSWRQPQPVVRRVAHGFPEPVAAIRALGNAVVPQVSEYVASCVMRHYIETIDR